MHMFSSSLVCMQNTDPIKTLRGADYTNVTKCTLSTIIHKVQSSENVQVQNPVILPKNIFSASNFFTHIFNMHVTHTQNIKEIQYKLCEELITQSMQYQPVFTRYSRRKMAKLKTCKFVKIFFFSIKLLDAHVL